MVSRTPTANATAVVVRNGRTILKNVRVEQRAGAAAQLFLQIFNTNAPTVGTTVPTIVIPIPAGDTQLMFTYHKAIFAGRRGGLDLTTGFSYAVTTTQTGSTAPTAGQEPLVEAHYEAVG